MYKNVMIGKPENKNITELITVAKHVKNISTDRYWI